MKSVSAAPVDGGKQFVRVVSVRKHFPGLKTFVFRADGERTKALAPQRAGNYIAITAKVGESLWAAVIRQPATGQVDLAYFADSEER